MVEPLVLLMINDEAEPALERTKEVGDASPDARLKAMLLPEVVVIELPPLYAFCRLSVCPVQVITSLEPLTQSVEPVEFCRPFTVRKLEPVVLMVTPLEPFGVKVD